MPRTNVGKTVSKLTKAERDAIIIRTAFARNGIYTQRDMAETVGASESTLSKAFKNGFSTKLIFRIHAAVDFAPEEREELLWKRP